MRSSIDWRWVAFFAATTALSLAMVGHAWWRKAGSDASLAAERTPPPVFDIGDAQARHALFWLQVSATEEWLGRRCDPTIADTFRVTHLQRSSHGSDIRTALVVGGNVARIKYSDDSLPGGRPVARPVEADVLARLRAPLVAAGYPDALPPAVESSPCGEFAMVESCTGGRYYGVVRECLDDKVFPLVDQVLDLARQQVGKTR